MFFSNELMKNFFFSFSILQLVFHHHFDCGESYRHILPLDFWNAQRTSVSFFLKDVIRDYVVLSVFIFKGQVHRIPHSFWYLEHLRLLHDWGLCSSFAVEIPSLIDLLKQLNPLTSWQGYTKKRMRELLTREHRWWVRSLRNVKNVYQVVLKYDCRWKNEYRMTKAIVTKRKLRTEIETSTRSQPTPSRAKLFNFRVRKVFTPKRYHTRQSVWSIHYTVFYIFWFRTKNARTLQRYFCFHLHTVLHVCPTAHLNIGINSKNITHTSFNYHFVFLTLFILGTVKHAVSNFSIPELMFLDLSKFNSDFVTSIVKFVREISEQTHFIFSFSHTSNARCVTSLQLLIHQFGELNSILPFVILICLSICSHQSVDLSFLTCMLCIFELSCSSFFCGLLQKLHCAEKASSCNFPNLTHSCLVTLSFLSTMTSSCIRSELFPYSSQLNYYGITVSLVVHTFLKLFRWHWIENQTNFRQLHVSSYMFLCICKAWSSKIVFRHLICFIVLSFSAIYVRQR